MEILTNIEKQRVLNNIPFWSIGGQKYPRYINSIYGVLDLEAFRRNNLKIESGENALIEFCTKIFGDVYQQYPIIITDLAMWRQCLIDTGLSNSDYYNKRFFVLDGFCPSRNLAIEADYVTTHDRSYDTARDKYIYTKHGIITHRVLGYGFNPKEDSESRKIMERRYRKVRWPTEYINYRPLALDQWLHRYPGLYEALELLAMGLEPKWTKELLGYYRDFCTISGRSFPYT